MVLSYSMEQGNVRQLKAVFIRGSVDRSPDGNLWLTVRDAETGTSLRPSSGPYTDVRHFLDICRLLPVTRDTAEHMYAVATQTGHVAYGPLELLDGKPMNNALQTATTLTETNPS